MKRYLSIDPKKLKKRHGFLQYCITKSQSQPAYRKMLIDASPVFIYPMASSIMMKITSIAFAMLLFFTGYTLWQSFEWQPLIISVVCIASLMTVITPFNKDAPPRRFPIANPHLPRDVALKMYSDFFTEKNELAVKESWEIWEHFLPTS